MTRVPLTVTIRIAGCKPPRQETIYSSKDLKKRGFNFKDGDGTLSDQEKADMWVARKARREARHKEMWAKCDKDGDGNISVEEITAGLEQMGAGSDRKKAFESNLTEEEIAAMKSMAEKWIKGMVAKVDANGDGQVSEEELAAGMDGMRDQFMKARSQCEGAK